MSLRRAVASTALFAFCYAQLVRAADISPQTWDATDRKHVEALEMNPLAPLARAIQGSSGIISNPGSPIAVYAGINALKQGGSAADAAATVPLRRLRLN